MNLNLKAAGDGFRHSSALTPVDFYGQKRILNERIAMTNENQTFVVSPGAQIPYSLLTPQEHSVLSHIVSNPSAANTKSAEAGRFVSILTNGKRFLWDSPAEKTVRILSIVDGTYKAA